MLFAMIYAGSASAQTQPSRSGAPGQRSAQAAQGNNPPVNSPQIDNQTSSTATADANRAAKETLDRVYIAMNLRKADGPPFHMLVRIRYEVDGKASDATYELLWAGPQTYRETFQIGGAEEIDVALDNRMNVSRSSIAVTLPLRDVREVLKSPVPGELMVNYDVVSVGNEQVDGQTRACIHVRKVDANTKQKATALACFDPASKEIASITAEGNYSEMPTNIRLDSFKTLGARRYPMHIASLVRGASVDATVETLENVTKFDGNPFVPPPGSAARDWCLTLAAAPSLEDFSQPTFSQAESKNLSLFFVLVGADGRVLQSGPVRATNSSNEQKIQSWLKTARFPIQHCGTTPVAYETFYTPVVKRN